MAVKIKLKRLGRTHRPFFRLAAMDSRRRRDGRVIEELGFYDPSNKDPGLQLRLEEERLRYWLSQGAQPTDTVRDLLKKQGVTAK